jgi:cobalamin synthase
MLPFWIALQFLSSLPIRLPGMPQPQELGRSLLFYPVVGLLFGVLLWGLNSVLMGAPLLLHAALLLTAWVLLSGGLHLDGLADSADAWLGGFGDRERTLTIMKDPRSGPIAVVTLGMVLLLKFTALVALIEQFGGDSAAAEVAHVATFSDGAVDRLAVGLGEGVVGHGLIAGKPAPTGSGANNAATAWGFEGK